MQYVRPRGRAEITPGQGLRLFGALCPARGREAHSGGTRPPRTRPGDHAAGGLVLALKTWAAMLVGGVCVLDEGNRMNEKSWASLAPLLDHRRYVESVVAGVTIAAHPDFRACVTMNEDESTYEVPDYILSRLQPTLTLGFPG